MTPGESRGASKLFVSILVLALLALAANEIFGWLAYR